MADHAHPTHAPQNLLQTADGKPTPLQPTLDDTMAGIAAGLKHRPHASASAKSAADPVGDLIAKLEKEDRARTNPLAPIAQGVKDTAAAAIALSKAAQAFPENTWSPVHRIEQKVTDYYELTAPVPGRGQMTPMDFIVNGGVALQQSFAKLPAGAKKVLVNVFDQDHDGKLNEAEFATAAAAASDLHARHPTMRFQQMLDQKTELQSEQTKIRRATHEVFDDALSGPSPIPGAHKPSTTGRGGNGR